MALLLNSQCSSCAGALQSIQSQGRIRNERVVTHCVSRQHCRNAEALRCSFVPAWTLRSLLPASFNADAARRFSSSVRAQESGTSTVVAQEVEFLWKGFGNEVLLTGDFLNWDGRVPLAKKGEGLFQVSQKVPPGQLFFKFIVDGVWQHSPDYPTIEDGAGGFNNVLQVTDDKVPPPKPKETAPPKAEEKKPEPKVAGEPAGKKAIGKAKVAGKKAAALPIGPTMEEQIIPLLRSTLEKEEGLSELSLTFADNQLRGSFLKGGVPYAFWCYFPDGTLDGARGFSLATHGGAPSTVEPFLIDERKVLPDLLVFWVQKRLFAQKLLSLN